MSLLASLSTANSSIFVSGEQTAVVSRNIANKDTPFYSRKSVEIISIPGSGVRTSMVTRTDDPVLFRKVLNSGSSASTQGAVLESLDLLTTTVGDPELDGSPAAMITKLLDALQSFSAQPQSKLAAEAAVRSANNLVTTLNGAASTVQSVRNEADTGIQASVDRVNSLLAQFKELNETIVKGTITKSDVTDYLDQRDQVLANLSNEIGIRTVTRGDNDMVIYTDSGVTLFDKSPRKVLFDKTLSMVPGQPGNAVYIDGVAVTGANATMPLQGGRIVGLIEARDEISLSYQAQLDEIARGLITTFAESDQVGAGADRPGLFTYGSATTIPPSGALIAGLASAIRVNPSVDPDAGGDAFLLRDGGISGNPDYVYNTASTASFTDRIDELIEKMGTPQAFDPNAKLVASGTLSDYATGSAGWLEEKRKVADEGYQYQYTLYQRSFEKFSSATGVNLDEEVSLMLELERSFTSSSKLISVIDNMYNALLGAIR